MPKAKKTAAQGSTLLVGDIGGTNTRLALYTDHGKRLLTESVFPRREHATFDAIVRAFLASTGARPHAAVLGVAGPVRAGAAKVTNLKWRLDERRLERGLGIRRISLHNDLVVAAYGCLSAP